MMMIVMIMVMSQLFLGFLMVCTHSLPKRCRLESRRKRDGTLRPLVKAKLHRPFKLLLIVVVSGVGAKGDFVEVRVYDAT